MRAGLLLLAVAAALPRAGGAQELTYSGSVVASSGSYIFTETTTTIGFHNALTARAGRLRLTGSVPLLLHNSGAVTAVGGGYLPTGGRDHEAVGSRQKGQRVPMGSGGQRTSALIGLAARHPAADSTVAGPGSYEVSLGDPLASAAVEVYGGFGVLRALEITAALKTPLNTLASGVGTGEWDYALGGAGVLALGPVLAFLDASYWWYGDLPGLILRDGMSLGGGLGLPVRRSVWLSAMATLGNRVIDPADPARSAALGVSYRSRSRGTFSFTGGVGLSETAPDVMLSFGWLRSFGSDSPPSLPTSARP